MKSTSSSEQSLLMGKWSSKTSEQNANRVRNNQRRHRARVKSRMEELEARLQETNAKLEAAQSTISSLKAQVEAFRTSQPSTICHLEAPRSFSDASPVLDKDPCCPQITNTSLEHSGSKIESCVPTPGPPSQDAVASVPALAAVEKECICECTDNAPPPGLGESTMSCSSAFQIIEQQNFSGVEVATIRAWLGPGFRLKPGEACRVETNRLYELLDHITSPT